MVFLGSVPDVAIWAMHLTSATAQLYLRYRTIVSCGSIKFMLFT